LKPVQFRFEFTHLGRQVAVSEPLMDVGKPVSVTISFGSLMPPLRSSLYWNQPQWMHVAAQLLVILNGQPVLAQPIESASVGPGQIVYSTLRLSHLEPVQEAELARYALPLMARHVIRGREWHGYPGPVRFTVRSLSTSSGVRQPLLSTGRLGVGDLLYWRIEPDKRVRIGFVSPGRAAIESELMTMREGEQELLVSTGALMPPPNEEIDRLQPELARLRGLLLVQFNGQVVLFRSANFHPSLADEVVFGANVVEASPARRYFEGWAGEMTPLDPMQVLTQSVQVMGLVHPPGPEWDGWPGPVRIRLQFPKNLVGKSEPLLATGRTGAGDVIFVHYLEGNRLQFGLDHWGTGGPLSEPVEIGPDGVHELVISFGALFRSLGRCVLCPASGLARLGGKYPVGFRRTHPASSRNEGPSQSSRTDQTG